MSFAPPSSLDDLLSVDRDVARAFGAWASWTKSVAREGGAEAHGDDEPLDRWRRVTGQSTYDALAEVKASAHDAPHREALRRWVHALLQARLARPLIAEQAKAAGEKSAQVTVPRPHLVSFHEAVRGVIGSETLTERAAWLDAAAQRGPALASIAKRRAERRHEAARRLGLDHADAAFPVPRAALAAAAQLVLDRTEDLASAIFREARARAELAIDPPVATDAIAIAIGRDAPEGWPAHLAARWLDTTFGAFARGLRIDLAALPSALGAASFARACASFGAALRVAGASPSLPFALARDPQFAAMHRFAFVFGALPASPAFQRRVLGNGARIAENQSRVLARTALFTARVEAARFLLAPDGGVPPRDLFEHVTARLFGAPLPAGLAGAFPARHEDGAARLHGLVTAPALSRFLIDQYDLDWFANPRAVPAVRALASGPAVDAEPATELAPHVAALARAFEEALG